MTYNIFAPFFNLDAGNLFIFTYANNTAPGRTRMIYLSVTRAILRESVGLFYLCLSCIYLAALRLTLCLSLTHTTLISHYGNPLAVTHVVDYYYVCRCFSM